MSAHHVMVFALLAAGVVGLRAHAAVLPAGTGQMAVRVEAGDYTVAGRTVSVSDDAVLAVDPPDTSAVVAERHILSDETPGSYKGGTSLALTLGPVDKNTRLPYVIVPDSVRVYSAGEPTVVYSENTDYTLGHIWGGMSRVPSGRIPDQCPVLVDYEVYLQRMDTVQISSDGKAAIKKGLPVPVCPQAPGPDDGYTAIANLYIPYRAVEITQDSIYPLPQTDTSWRDCITVSGTERVRRVVSSLKSGDRVTVVCWGDSVTVGASASSPEKSYVGLLRSRLQAAYPKAQIDVINAGIGGSNTDSRRDGYNEEVLSHNPDLITVEFVNDLGKTPDQIKANYAEFITQARRRNPEVEFIILTPHFVMPDWMGNYANSVAAMRRAATDNNVALGDAGRIWESLRKLGIPYEALLANAINHPNGLGHEFYADTLMAVLAGADR